jgi:hypothetical protein
VLCKLDIKNLENGSFMFRIEKLSSCEVVIQWQSEYFLRNFFKWDPFRDNGFRDIVDRYEFILTALMYYNEKGIKTVSCDMLSWEDIDIVKAISKSESILDELIDTCL